MNGTKISIERGIYGDKWDPTGWDDITVERLGKKIKIHIGLTIRLWIDDKEIINTEDVLYELFELHAGMSTSEAEEYYHKAKYRCRCGRTDLIEQDGYPGETLYICTHCDSIVTSDQDMGAII
jgi:DNA-directed RNA polymerase subunit RPC12/RpoP